MPSLIFTIEGTSRHEVIAVHSDTSLLTLKNNIIDTSHASPNCTEIMAQYANKPGTGETKRVAEIKVRWATAGRDAKTWPASTVVTEENFKALLHLLDGGKDVLEVKIE